MAADVFIFKNPPAASAIQTFQHCVYESEMIRKAKADVMNVFSLPKLRDLHEVVGRFGRIQCCIFTFHNLKLVKYSYLSYNKTNRI